MTNIKMELSYDGTAYHGWQYQENAISLQQVIEQAICGLTGENIRIIGCSRTDTGVHAKKYVCNFKTDCKIPPEKLPYALNARLPSDIAIHHCKQVGEDFHARFSALSKKYRYAILNAPFRDPLLQHRAWHYPLPLDMDKMRLAATHLVGKLDFAAFMATGSQQKQSIRHMYEISLDKRDKTLYINLWADGYLYNMVRIIAGTLAYVGCGKIDAAHIPIILAMKDRTGAGITAPAHGLMLMDVLYAQDESARDYL